MTKNTRIPMVFGDGKEHNGADGWFWGDLTGKGPADEPNTFPFVLQMGVWRGELTLEQARELRDLRGYQWWSKLDFRAVREYLAGQEGKEPRAKQALADEQAGAMIDALRQATAALLEADKAYNPDQPRHPAGDPRGGQWAAEEGGGAGVYDISPDARFALAQAINAVQDHGLATGNERLIVLDAEGKVLSDTKGDYESVSDLGAVDSPDAFVTVHNHPRSASFSEADIRLFLSTAMSHMVVIGHDGTIYTASKRPNTKKISRWENGDMPEDQRYVFNEWNTIKMKEFPRYQVLVTTGKMSGDSAWKEHTHEIGTELAMVLGYDYKRYL